MMKSQKFLYIKLKDIKPSYYEYSRSTFCWVISQNNNQVAELYLNDKQNQTKIMLDNYKDIIYFKAQEKGGCYFGDSSIPSKKFKNSQLGKVYQKTFVLEYDDRWDLSIEYSVNFEYLHDNKYIKSVNFHSANYESQEKKLNTQNSTYKNENSTNSKNSRQRTSNHNDSWLKIIEDVITCNIWEERMQEDSHSMWNYWSKTYWTEYFQNTIRNSGYCPNWRQQMRGNNLRRNQLLTQIINQCDSTSIEEQKNIEDQGIKDENDGEIVSSLCKIHNLNGDIFCKDCFHALCIQCILSKNHNDHNVTELQKFNIISKNMHQIKDLVEMKRLQLDSKSKIFEKMKQNNKLPLSEKIEDLKDSLDAFLENYQTIIKDENENIDKIKSSVWKDKKIFDKASTEVESCLQNKEQLCNKEITEKLNDKTKSTLLSQADQSWRDCKPPNGAIKKEKLGLSVEIDPKNSETQSSIITWNDEEKFEVTKKFDTEAKTLCFLIKHLTKVAVNQTYFCELSCEDQKGKALIDEWVLDSQTQEGILLYETLEGLQKHTKKVDAKADKISYYFILTIEEIGKHINEFPVSQFNKIKAELSKIIQNS
jgi:hypothetical protein